MMELLMTQEIITKLVTVFIIFVSGSLLSILKMEWRIHKDVKELKKRSDNTRGENIMQFRLLRALTRIMRCLVRSVRNGTKNGELNQAEREVDEIEKKIEIYLAESIH
jgi:tetrahydromethanopterin S-methyltransferase subunit G